MSATLLLVACLVISVHDGDSLTVKCPARTKPIAVRLAAIDAPEVASVVFGKHMAGQPDGKESKESLASLCLGQTVNVRRIAIDRYGRSISFVLCQGHDASVHQIDAGHAWSYEAPKAQAVALAALQERARAAHRGLWAYPNPVSPSTWRKASQ